MQGVKCESLKVIDLSDLLRACTLSTLTPLRRFPFGSVPLRLSLLTTGKIDSASSYSLPLSLSFFRALLMPSLQLPNYRRLHWLGWLPVATLGERSACSREGRAACKNPLWFCLEASCKVMSESVDELQRSMKNAVSQNLTKNSYDSQNIRAINVKPGTYWWAWDGENRESTEKGQRARADAYKNMIHSRVEKACQRQLISDGDQDSDSAVTQGAIC